MSELFSEKSSEGDTNHQPEITKLVPALDPDLDNHSISEFTSHSQPWWKVKHLWYLNFCIFVVTLSSTNNGYDGSMLNGFQSLQTWETKMGHPTGHILGALANGQVFGGIIGIFIAPALTDKLGRWWAIVIGQIVSVVGAMLQGASTNYAFFLVSRIILGIGTLIAAVASPTLISEIAYPTHRQVVTTWYNTNWYLGAVIAAWVTYGTRNIKSSTSWRLPSYLQAAMPALQISLFLMVPESPRFLVSKGKIAKAEEVLVKYHTGGSTDERAKNLVKFELGEIEKAIRMEKLANKTKYTDFFTRKSYRRRLFICMFLPVLMQLSGNGLVSFYLPKVMVTIGITDPDRQLQINGCLMIYNLVVAIFIASVAGYFRRRTMFLFATIGMVMTFLIWTILSAINEQRDFKDKSFANGVLAMIFLFYVAFNAGANGLPFLYLTEVLPYSHRAKGINIVQGVLQVISIFNGFVNPIAMDAISWTYYIVYCCVDMVEVITVYFMFPETSGYTLEEVTKVFGDDADHEIAMLASPHKLSVEHVEHTLA